MKKIKPFLLLLLLILSNSVLLAQTKIDFISDTLLNEIERFINYEDSVVKSGRKSRGNNVINIDFYDKGDGFAYLSINSSLWFHKQGLIGGFIHKDRLIAFYAGRIYYFVGLIDPRELSKEFPSDFIPFEGSNPPPYRERTFEYRIINPNELIFLNKNF